MIIVCEACEFFFICSIQSLEKSVICSQFDIFFRYASAFYLEFDQSLTISAMPIHTVLSPHLSTPSVREVYVCVRACVCVCVCVCFKH